MPIGERLFRLVWLRAPGRAFLRMSMRSASASRAAASGAAPATTATPRAPQPGRDSSPGPAVTLEQRVAALERWRDSMK
jgi:hypothetical protein